MTDLRQVSFVVDNNMVVIEREVESMIPGTSERECIIKRFFWTDNGRFYVYQSSVPDEIHPDEEDGRDDATRFDMLH